MRVLADASAGRAELDVSVVARRNGAEQVFRGVPRFNGLQLW